MQKSAGGVLGEVYDLYCVSAIHNNLASYQVLKMLNVEQSQKMIDMYHAKIKIVAGFSLPLVDHLLLVTGRRIIRGTIK